MEYGIVQWFNPTKGYGFITTSDNKSAFVHHSKIQGQSGFRSLNEHDRVTFTRQYTDKGLQAINVRVIE